jgi:hypothetical protein
MAGLPATNGQRLAIRKLTLDGESQTGDMSAYLIAQTDHFHAPPLLDPRANWHKEWHHFCIVSSDIQVILNFNLSGDIRPEAPPGAQLTRVILLVREGCWDGDVDSILPRDSVFRPGVIDLHFGHNSVRFENGIFKLSAALQDRPVGLVLQLRPIALPMLMRNNVPIGLGTINWLVVPRLVASGTVTVGRQVHILNEAPTYHDHNWGSWLWGQDFAWEWGFALPDHVDVPWSLVFDRTLNRRRSHILESKLALWKNSELRRVFTQSEIKVLPAGHLSVTRLPKFPRVMALVAPEFTTDIPRYLDISAAAGADSLLCHFEARDVAQIIIPNETDLGITVLNEVTGHLELEGNVKGELVHMQGGAIFEFLTQ